MPSAQTHGANIQVQLHGCSACFLFLRRSMSLAVGNDDQNGSWTPSVGVSASKMEGNKKGEREHKEKERNRTPYGLQNNQSLQDTHTVQCPSTILATFSGVLSRSTGRSLYAAENRVKGPSGCQERDDARVLCPTQKVQPSTDSASCQAFLPCHFFRALRLLTDEKKKSFSPLEHTGDQPGDAGPCSAPGTRTSTLFSKENANSPPASSIS